MKVIAMVHSKEQREEVELLETIHEGKNGKYYIVKTNDGVLCTAIFNPFNCIYYADDLYGIVKEDDYAA